MTSAGFIIWQPMGVFLLFTALRVLRQVGFGEPGVPNLRFWIG
jgi:hypothetical protein